MREKLFYLKNDKILNSSELVTDFNEINHKVFLFKTSFERNIILKKMPIERKAANKQ